LKKFDNNRHDYFLDITDEICPMTFVKTKLLIERMEIGQIAEVRLRGQEPLENVPRSVKEFGHDVISMNPEEDNSGKDGTYRLLIRKKK